MQSTITHIDDLIEGCRRGNQRAQLEIYNRFCKAMYNTALRIVHDNAEAEDIIQESFISAFEKIGSFNADASFGAWLKRIVINNSISVYNKKYRYKEISYTDYFKTEVEEPYSDIAVEEDKSEKARKILKAMESLKENYRISLTLYLIEGYDYDEISQILNLSYANCRTTISRAKESLRNKMMKDEK